MQRAGITLKSALANAKILTHLMAVSAEVFCRHSFGRRYSGQLVLSFLCCAFYTLAIQTAAPSSTSPLSWLHLIVFFGLVCFHVASIFTGGRGQGHSYASGTSWGIWRRFSTNATTVHLLLEPGACLALGLFLALVDKALSVWFLAAGVSLFAKGLVIRWDNRQQLLDAVDARIDGQQLNEAIRAQQSAPADGEQAINSVLPAQLSAQRPRSLREMMNQIDPALRRLISQPRAEPHLAHDESRTPGSVISPGRPPKPVERVHHAGPLGSLPRITSPSYRRRP